MPDFFKDFKTAASGYKKFFADPFQPLRKKTNEEMERHALLSLMKKGKDVPEESEDEKERKRKAVEEGMRKGRQALGKK